jgi:two-component system LytT family response regulator
MDYGLWTIKTKNMTIKAIIIDDEEGNIQNLHNLLSTYCPEVSILATAGSAKEGIEVIKKYEPDLVFLDIEMPRGTGFDMLDNLPEIIFEVVFVTAYNQYAIKAIRFCALDYLLKPINVEELKASVGRVAQKLEQRRENERMRLFMQHMQHPGKPRKIALPMADEVQFVEIDQIIYCLGENNYTYFFLSNGKKLLVTKTLKEYEELLSEHGFLRVHRSYLINLSYVKAYVKKEGGYILMTNDAQISISQSKRKEILEVLGRV